MRRLESVQVTAIAATLAAFCNTGYANPTQLSDNDAGETPDFYAMAANGSNIILANSSSTTVIINNDASNETELPNVSTSGSDDQVILADNGDTVFFSSEADLLNLNISSVRSIFTTASDGSTLNQISPPDVDVFEFDVVASTNVVVFTTDANPAGMNADRSTEIFSVDQGGANLTQISDFPESTDITELHVSADGAKVVFASSATLSGSNADGNPEVYTLGIDLADLTRITDGGDASIPIDIAASGFVVQPTIAFISTVDHTGDNPGNQIQFFTSNVDASQIRQISDFTVYAGAGPTPDDLEDALADLNPRLSRNGDMLFFAASGFDESGEKTEESSPNADQDIYYFTFENSSLSRAIADGQLLDVSTGASSGTSGGFSGVGGLINFVYKSDADLEPDGVKGGNADGSAEIFHFATADLNDAPGAITGLGPEAEYPYDGCSECLVGEEDGGGSMDVFWLLAVLFCGFGLRRDGRPKH